MRIPTMKRPSPATAIALLALFVAMGGTAEAVRTQAFVHKGDIAHGAVSSKALAEGAVTAPKIRKGAVTAPKIAHGAVHAGALAGGSVGASALAPSSVGTSALVPGSVGGGTLGAVTLHTAPIVDRDESADLSTWTASDTVVASCGAGERVLSGGVAFTNPGNRRVAIIRSSPLISGTTQGWIGQITSDSGGTAAAEVEAVCLQ